MARPVLTLRELRALDVAEITALQRDHPAQYARSMAALTPSSKSTPTAPVPPSAEELAQPALQRGYLTHAELAAATGEQVQMLAEQHPAIYQRSLDMLALTKAEPRSVTDLIESEGS